MNVVSAGDLSFDQPQTYGGSNCFCIHIFREEASFQRPDGLWFSESARGIYVGSDQCEIIGRRWFNGSDECDPDGQLVKVHKCEGHGTVYRAFVQLMSRRDIDFRPDSLRTKEGRAIATLPYECGIFYPTMPS